MEKKENNTERSRKKRRHADRTLRVFVCDEHSDALEEIHRSIRRKELPYTAFAMMHFDAHPDLCVSPTMDAEFCFEPTKLYDFLDSSEGGIAEWILPLVYEGHLSSLWWVRPTWAKQLEDGNRVFAVGKLKAENKENKEYIRVSARDAYFLDDFLYAPIETMTGVRPLKLTVTTASRLATFYFRAESAPSTEAAKGGEISEEKPYVLDICLDYFSTLNPFVKTMNETFPSDIVDLVRWIYAAPRFKNSDLDLKRALTERRRFRDGLRTLIANEAAVVSLAKLYDEGSTAERSLRQLRDYCKSIDQETFDTIFRCGPMLDLPHHQSDAEEIDGMVTEMEKALSKGARSRRPALVTIACSTRDGYFPSSEVERTLGAVLGMLRRLFGSISVASSQYLPSGVQCAVGPHLSRRGKRQATGTSAS
eukprot:g1032.t1